MSANVELLVWPLLVYYKWNLVKMYCVLGQNLPIISSLDFKIYFLMILTIEYS